MFQKNPGHSSVKVSEIFMHFSGGTDKDKNPMDELDM